MDQAYGKKVAIIGAGIFGLSLAVALRRKGHQVHVFDVHDYHKSAYQPPDETPELVASVDHNKIFRASYGTKLHYQRLALESREQWTSIDKERQDSLALFVPSGMLRVQPTAELSALEKETLANMERDGLRDSQFVEGNAQDRERAAIRHWEHKLLKFAIPNDADGRNFEAVLDSLAGFTRCSDACAYFQQLAEKEGVSFTLGKNEGRFESLVDELLPSGKRRATGARTADGIVHAADTVVVAAGSFSTQVLPELAYHLESSAGSIAAFKLDPQDKHLWDKYSSERFPVITWKSTPRDNGGKDTGSVYVLPRTPEGLVKIGYRGIKFTNFQNAPNKASFDQDGLWSIPLKPEDCSTIPPPAVHAIRQFVAIFLPELSNVAFHSTRLCWYTDTLDNSFLIDYVPEFADKSVFVCTGGSGHGAKFLPVLGKHAADIFENGIADSNPLHYSWRWRPDAKRANGLEEGPGGHRNIGKRVRNESQ